MAATKTYTASLAAIAALTVELSGDAALGSDLERIAAAMQEQLGLKLEATKAPGDILVIDHVGQPSEN